MVIRLSDKSRYNPKVFTSNWLQKVSTEQALNIDHQRIFNTFSGTLVSTTTDPNLEKLSRTRATPISRLNLRFFAKRLKLLQKIHICDIRRTFKNYTERKFSQELKILIYARQPDGSYPRTKFLKEFPPWGPF